MAWLFISNSSKYYKKLLLCHYRLHSGLSCLETKVQQPCIREKPTGESNNDQDLYYTLKLRKTYFLCHSFYVNLLILTRHP